MDTGSFTKTYFRKLSGAIDGLDYGQWDEAVELVRRAWEEDRFIYTFGNGGSGSTASHFAMDWGKGISYATKRKMKVVCLNDSAPILLAYANDISHESIFVEQLKNLLRPGDLVIGISGSGNSKNVLNAIEYANQKDAVTIGLCGYDGGQLRKIARQSVWIDIPDMQIVEDLHLSFGHVVMQKLTLPST
jgi:D-sedoheptulose 7-phosphate isomerase